MSAFARNAMSALKKAVEAFLADLLMAQIGKRPKQWV
jgi:hypothetical protein